MLSKSLMKIFEAPRKEDMHHGGGSNEMAERPQRSNPRTSTAVDVAIGMGADEFVRAIIDAQNHNGGPVTLEFIRGNASTGEFTLIFERAE